MRAVIAAAALLVVGAGKTAADVDPATLSSIVRTLASTDFEGRAPGSAGEKKTIAYLVERFKALGLEPGGPNSNWTQAVPLIHTQLGAGDTAVIDADGKRTALVRPGDLNLTTVGAAPRIDIAGAPMVFVGYGVTAPELGWDDFKGVDLKGKVAVFLVNDPDFEAAPGEDAKGKFGDRRMTYYGRWTYKFDEAARRGAVAALIVHDTEGAGYGWSTVSANNGENYDIVRAAGDRRVPLQGWIAHDVADRLFAAAGQDLKALRKAARTAAFRPIALPLRFAASLPVKVERIISTNVLARLPGKTRPAESVMFGAHWDAYGRDPAGGGIRPGANDDALGVAGVLELARLFKAGPAPDRTLLFALWTAEERGLLGSEYYAANPVYPLATTAANLTLDILQTAGRARDVVLVGAGNSTLDTLLGDAARAQGRTITPETFSERGLFYRADHFSVVRRGVPALQLMTLGGAADLTIGGRPAGQQWLDGYMACYHKACDAWDARWDLTGAAQDVGLFHAMGSRLAKAGVWPTWRAGSEFTRERAKTATARR